MKETQKEKPDSVATSHRVQRLVGFVSHIQTVMGMPQIKDYSQWGEWDKSCMDYINKCKQESFNYKNKCKHTNTKRALKSTK